MEWILATKGQCPSLLTGQSPPALLWCVMVWHTAQCWPVGCTANVHLLQFFSGEKLIFVWLLTSATGQPTCASWWWCLCLLSGGWLALSLSSWVLCLWALGSVHLPWAPHWTPEIGCCHAFTTPFGRGGSCTRPMAVDKPPNSLPWYKIDGSFILSSHTSVQVKVDKGVYPGCTNRSTPKEGEEKEKNSTI